MIYKIKLFYHTAKYMTPRQWKYRFLYEIKKYFAPMRRFTVPVINEVRIISTPFDVVITDNEKPCLMAEDICKNRFLTIGSEILEFGDVIDWDLKGEHYRLLCFKLNAFGYLLALSDAYHLAGNIKYIEKGFELIRNWWERNGGKTTGDKWNAYVVADRIVHWIGFVSCYKEMISENDFLMIAEWIAAQANYLFNNMEYHLGANHLLSEAKSLVFAGAFLKNEKMYESGISLLLEEYDEQFLKDGGHYERSISYHIESLQQYVECAMLMFLLQDNRHKEIVEKLYSPFYFLHKAIGPDGTIPLVNDASDDYPLEALDFYAVASRLFLNDKFTKFESPYAKRWVPESYKPLKIPQGAQNYTSLFPYTGFVMDHTSYDGRKQFVFMDAGNHGPDYNLGHAHADALSVLWTVDGDRILVDGGTYTYQPGEKRNAYRSTKSHNTIEIDGTNNAEIWGAFRVARRGHTSILDALDKEDELIVVAEHDGYSRCLAEKIFHKRTLYRCKQYLGFALIDEIYGCFRRERPIVSRFHVFPGYQITQVDTETIRINNQYYIHSTEALNITQSVISLCFGEERSSYCVQINSFTSQYKKIITSFGVGGCYKSSKARLLH